MAFIIVADSKSHEIDRRELAGPVIVGRSPECDLPMRDILLSRKHCVIERLGETWVIADLGSKNGTLVNGELIQRHVLHDCDVIRIGRTRIAFRDGPVRSGSAGCESAKPTPGRPDGSDVGHTFWIPFQQRMRNRRWISGCWKHSPGQSPILPTRARITKTRAGDDGGHRLQRVGFGVGGGRTQRRKP